MNRDDEKKQEGAQELEKLRIIVAAWKKSHAKSAAVDGGGDFVYEDFQDEIHSMILPYLWRLYQTNHVSLSEVHEFLEYCSQQIRILREDMEEES